MEHEDKPGWFNMEHEDKPGWFNMEHEDKPGWFNMKYEDKPGGFNFIKGKLVGFHIGWLDKSGNRYTGSDETFSTEEMFGLPDEEPMEDSGPLAGPSAGGAGRRPKPKPKQEPRISKPNEEDKPGGFNFIKGKLVGFHIGWLDKSGNRYTGSDETFTTEEMFGPPDEEPMENCGPLAGPSAGGAGRRPKPKPKPKQEPRTSKPNEGVEK